MRIIISILLLLIAFCVDSQLYTFRNYTHKDGLFISSVNTLAEASDGHIWLGTDGAGLIKFDGSKFVDFSYKNFDNKRFVKDLRFGKDQKMYVSSYYLGFAEIDQFGRPKITFDNTYLHNSNLASFAIGKNNYYISNYGIYDSKTLRSKKEPLVEFSSQINSVKQIITMDHAAIVFTSGGNFFITEDGIRNLEKTFEPYNNKNIAYSFGRFHLGRLELFDETLTNSTIYNIKEKGFIVKVNNKTYESVLDDTNPVTIVTYDERTNLLFAYTENGDFVKMKDASKIIAFNYDEPIKRVTSLMIDKHQSLWVGTSENGIYKLSIEPFTKVLLDPTYGLKDIFTIHANSKILVLSNRTETFVGHQQSDIPIKSYPFRTTSATENNRNIYLASDEGVKIVTEGGELKSLNNKYFDQKPISSIAYKGKHLWIAVTGDKLYKCKIIDGKLEVKKSYILNASHIYRIEESWDASTLFIGTNNGLYKYDYKKDLLSKQAIPSNLGSYLGNSAIDSYKTIWFTVDRGLVGMDRYGNMLVIDDKKYFESTLFYTLSSDNFGNLYIGTNKGITVLNVDENGLVKTHQTYGLTNGFDGYETNMRASFTNEYGTFLGTIEGLYLIRPAILEELSIPEKPIIYQQFKEGDAYRKRHTEYTFEFKVINPRYSSLQYSYRILEKSKEWSNLNELTSVTYSNLNEGEYTFQVKASYDGIKFSEIAESKLIIKVPFYQSNLFIIVLIFLLALINIYLISRFKKVDTTDTFETKDFGIQDKTIPFTILVGGIAVNTMHYFITKYDSSVVVPTIFLFACLIVSIVLGLFALFAFYSGRKRYLKTFLIIAYSFLLAEQLFLVYYSSINTYFLAHALLLFTMSAIILPKLKIALYFSGVYLISSISIAYFYINQYSFTNVFVFFSVTLIAVFYMIFSAYIRFYSIDKLVFISGVVNKGNVPVIAFNHKGTITYASENINIFFDMNHEALLGQKISSLNDYVPEKNKGREVNLNEEFIDGSTYIVPMYLRGKTVWVEWLCKKFSSTLKVIHGVDITERMEIESNYELLVQNANDLIYQTDIKGNFIFLNQKSLDTFGYGFDELKGKSLIQFIPPEYHFEILKFYKNQYNNRIESTYFEFPMKASNGQVIWIGQNVTSLFDVDKNGAIKGFLSVARDITENRRQTQIISQQAKDITDSINYARRIQFNLLPNQKQFDESFDESFIIYKPKDIVSGDFYFLDTVGDYSILIVADCTGHGVPGSFMTLLGINLLNSIIQENKITDPAEILSQLNKRLLYVLPRGTADEKINDGMEVTVCIFDAVNSKIQYACAGSKFMIFRNGKLEMLKGDGHHIGDNIDLNGHTQFTNHILDIHEDDVFYFFSDGFQDQFGGKKDKKFSFRRMYELITVNSKLPLYTQYSMIEDEFYNWKGVSDQTDDIMLLGIKGPKKPQNE